MGKKLRANIVFFVVAFLPLEFMSACVLAND